MAVSQGFPNGRSLAKVVTAFGVVWLAISLSACDRGKEAEKKQAAPAPPPPAVVVAEVIQKTVPIYSEFVAQTDAKETVEIRARVQAFLEAQHFTEGTVVKKDQLLFTLDKREYEAQLQQAKAQLSKAQADLAFAKDNAIVESAKSNLDVALAALGKAETDERRLKPLAERRAVPQQDYDTAAANLDAARAAVASQKSSLNTAQVNQKSSIEQAEAAVAAAKASIVQAELNLSYCTILSPIEGLIGKRQVSPGNLVGKGEATLLDTVSSIDPIRVNVSISEAEYLRFMEQQKKGRASAPVALELILADGSVFPHKGRVVITDRAVDVKTGTLSLIAEFPNPQGLLRPGQFGRVRAPAEVVENAILVPQRAVQEIQGAKTVLVVGADNMVALRTITPTGSVGDLLIVRDGVQPGDRVIVDGIQKARPGTKVAPTAAPAPPVAAPQGAGAPGLPAPPAKASAPEKAAAPGEAKPAAPAESKGAATKGRERPAEATKSSEPPAKPAPGPPPAPTPAKKAAASPAGGAASTSSHATWPDPYTREALVQRLLRGESAQALAQETGIPAQRIEAWRVAYLKDGKQGLLQ
jgi:membrane fusion protein (multidrug efflux system)